MKWGKRMMLGMLVMSVFFSTVILGKNLWMQEKEELRFVSLRKSISEVREDHPSSSGPQAEQADEMNGRKKEREILPEYQELAAENPDFSGWVSIEGTRIDYPVMQTLDDPEYYLHRNFDREYSYAGVPFVGTGDMGEKNEDIFIYGHNMRNGTMFADLQNYQRQGYGEEHRIICLDTLWEKQEYEVFAVLNVSEDEWNQEGGLFYEYDRNFSTNREEYLQKIKRESLYRSDIRGDVQERLVFLVTCSYQRKNGRIVVVGVTY